MKRLASVDKTSRLGKKVKLDRPAFTLKDVHPTEAAAFGPRILLTHWNVNGLKARLQDPQARLATYLQSKEFDIICFNEAKVAPDVFSALDIPSHPLFSAYHQYWAFPRHRKGYSGTAVLTRQRPLRVTEGIGVDVFDDEGRTLTLEFDAFTLVAVYVPNAGSGAERFQGRVESWDQALRAHVARLDGQKPLVLLGDLNVAHEPIDLARPKANQNSACFTKEERANFSALLATGLLDVFRKRNPDTVTYSYWCQRTNSRKSNCGWRLDYCLANPIMEAKIVDMRIRDDVYGSDHCPVEVEIENPAPAAASANP